ncbi:MAG: hypothetical protein AB1531_09680 [Chloroflexota bacterium]
MKSVTVSSYPRRLYLALTILVAATLACGTVTPQPSPTKTSTPTPKVGVPVFGVTCDPVPLEMIHGETKTIAIADTGGEGKVTEFKVGTIAGTASDPAASEISVSQQPAPGDSGWSTLPGTITVVSTAVDGPERTETYFINILVGGRQGDDHITGGNIWCQVNVKHIVPTATFTLTPTATITLTKTKPPFIVTGSGYRIQYTGPFEAQMGGTLAASFQVFDARNQPAMGLFSASLGDPPTDHNASHASGQLDQLGMITLMLDVNWPPGVTKLFFNFDGETFEVGEIIINP